MCQSSCVMLLRAARAGAAASSRLGGRGEMRRRGCEQHKGWDGLCDRASRRPERTPPELSFNPSSMVCHKTVVRCCRHVTCERAGRWPAAAERKATCQLRARCCCCCLNLGTRAAKRVCCAVSLSESMHPVAASDLQAWASRSLSRCFLVSCARALVRSCVVVGGRLVLSR